MQFTELDILKLLSIPPYVDVELWHNYKAGLCPRQFCGYEIRGTRSVFGKLYSISAEVHLFKSTLFMLIDGSYTENINFWDKQGKKRILLRITSST